MVTKEKWNQDCAHVTQMMEMHVAKFVTPLAMSEEHGSGTAWGTGTYIQGTEHVCVLTAAHVIENLPPNGRLAHLPREGAEYNAAFGTPAIAPWPVDAAALPIYPDPAFLPNAGSIVSNDSIAQRYDAIDKELLFWMGFPGYTLERNDPTHPKNLRSSIFEQLTTPMKPMLTQAIDSAAIVASNFNSSQHIAVHYPQMATRASDGETVVLPNAAGMSGSALWNTKFRECSLAGTPWSPEMAEICGIVWAVLNKPEAIFVTKIEYVRAGLLNIF